MTLVCSKGQYWESARCNTIHCPTFVIKCFVLLWIRSDVLTSFSIWILTSTVEHKCDIHGEFFVNRRFIKTVGRCGKSLDTPVLLMEPRCHPLALTYLLMLKLIWTVTAGEGTTSANTDIGILQFPQPTCRVKVVGILLLLS